MPVKKTKKLTKNRKLNYQINFAATASKMKHKIVELAFCASKNRKQLYDKVDALIEYIATTVEAVRKGRHYPRRFKNIKNGAYFVQYKSAL